MSRFHQISLILPTCPYFFLQPIHLTHQTSRSFGGVALLAPRPPRPACAEAGACCSEFVFSFPSDALSRSCVLQMLIDYYWMMNSTFFLHIQRDICTYHTIKHCIYHHYPAARGLRGPFLKCCEMIYIVKWSSTCTTPAFVITKWVLKQQSREYMTHGLAMSRWEVAVLPKSYKHNSGAVLPNAAMANHGKL